MWPSSRRSVTPSPPGSCQDEPVVHVGVEVDAPHGDEPQRVSAATAFDTEPAWKRSSRRAFDADDLEAVDDARFTRPSPAARACA